MKKPFLNYDPMFIYQPIEQGCVREQTTKEGRINMTKTRFSIYIVSQDEALTSVAHEIQDSRSPRPEEHD